MQHNAETAFCDFEEEISDDDQFLRPIPGVSKQVIIETLDSLVEREKERQLRLEKFGVAPDSTAYHGGDNQQRSEDEAKEAALHDEGKREFEELMRKRQVILGHPPAGRNEQGGETDESDEEDEEDAKCTDGSGGGGARFLSRALLIQEEPVGAPPVEGLSAQEVERLEWCLQHWRCVPLALRAGRGKASACAAYLLQQVARAPAERARRAVGLLERLALLYDAAARPPAPLCRLPRHLEPPLRLEHFFSLLQPLLGVDSKPAPHGRLAGVTEARAPRVVQENLPLVLELLARLLQGGLGTVEAAAGPDGSARLERLAQACGRLLLDPWTCRGAPALAASRCLAACLDCLQGPAAAPACFRLAAAWCAALHLSRRPRLARRLLCALPPPAPPAAAPDGGAGRVACARACACEFLEASGMVEEKALRRLRRAVEEGAVERVLAAAQECARRLQIESRRWRRLELAVACLETLVFAGWRQPCPEPLRAPLADLQSIVARLANHSVLCRLHSRAEVGPHALKWSLEQLRDRIQDVTGKVAGFSAPAAPASRQTRLPFSPAVARGSA